MKANDFLKLDTWVLVEKEWPNPLQNEVRNTGKVLGPFASGEEALNYALGLCVGTACWKGRDGEVAIGYLDMNQKIENKDFESDWDSTYARYFWYPEKLER